jgi:hypothetical protein
MADARRAADAWSSAAFGQMSSMWSRRLGEYVDVWERGTSKLLSSTYRSEDLLDDWFALWGKLVRDTTAAAAVTWKAYGADPEPGTQDDPTVAG